MKRFTLLLVALLGIGSLKAQDPEFTQFYANKLYLNPAFAGTGGGPRFSLNYRNQWPSISNAFETYSVSYDQHFDAIGGGVGVQAWHDRAGDGELTTTVVSAMYSYNLNVTRDFTIKAGLQASGYTRSVDFSKLRFEDQIDPRRGFVRPTQEPLPKNGTETIDPYPDFSAGFMGFTEKYYAGFSVHHITEPTQSFYNNPNNTLPRKFTGHVGMMLPLDNAARNPESFISPNIMYQRQGKFTQVNVGGYYIHKFFVTGLWFRQTAPNSDALMALVGLKKDPFKIGYSYDLTVSEARPAAKGSHEISLVIQLDPPDRRQVKEWRKLSCPDF